MKDVTICIGLLLFAFAAYSRTNNALVEGVVKEPLPKIIYIIANRIPDLGAECTGDIIDSSLVNDNGTFHIHFIPDPQSVYSLVDEGNNYIYDNLYLCAGDSIFIIRNDSIHSATIMLDKRGANIFYQNYRKKFDDDPLFSKNFAKDYRHFYAYIEHKAIAEKIYLQEHENKFSDYIAMNAELQASLYYGSLSRKIEYLTHRYWSDDYKPVINDKRCLLFMDSMKFEQKPYLKTRAYAGFIGAYYEWKISNLIGSYSMHAMRLSEDTLNKRRFIIARDYFSGESQDVAMVEAVTSMFTDSHTSHLIGIAYSQFDDFRRFYHDKRYLEYFEAVCAKYKELLPGNIIADYYLPDTSNHPIAFSQFRGKTIYVEYWGTWCGPCVHELNVLKKLQHHFTNDTNLIFYSIAIPGYHDTYDLWKTFVKDSMLGGIQVYAKNESGRRLVRDYIIDAVPQYWLIDKRGKIITTSAEHPFEEGVVNEIKQAELQ